tara:strand:- start:28561 stop:28767 length:207 start_codon:yes stop_codon:yes gene_type:complete
MIMSAQVPQHGPKSKARCPVCDNPVVEKYRPFCSARCADVDLGRWLKGAYAIPTEEAPDNPSPPDEET